MKRKFKTAINTVHYNLHICQIQFKSNVTAEFELINLRLQSKCVNHNAVATTRIFNAIRLFDFRYDALNRSLYYEHMKLWLKYFPLSQFHVVNGDRLIKKPWHEVIRVEKFLGVDHQVCIKAAFLHNFNAKP